MKKVVCVLLFLACGLSLAAADFPKNDITYSTEVVTPHIPWAKPLAGGPLKAFCIVPIAEGRDLIELMQRVALEPITVSIDRNWDVNCWGIGDFYGHEFRGDRDDFQTVYGYVERHLTSDDKFDVILLPGLNGWSRLTRASRDAILRRVQEGAGLVLIHPFVGDVAGHPFKGDETVGDKRIWEVSPLVNCPDDPVGSGGYPQLNLEAITKARWEKAAPHAITDGFAFELLPAAVEGCRIYKYEPAGQVLIQAGGHPVLAVKQYGKGRVVSLAYVEEGYIPEAVDPVASRIYWNYWEYYYSLLARCLRWAAGRDSDFTVESMAATSDGKLEVQVRAGRQAEVELEFHAGSEFEEKQKVSSFRRSIKKGTTTTTFEISDLLPDEYAGGRQIVNLVVREPGSGVALASGSSVRGLPQQARIRQVRPNSEVYREGDLIGVETAVSGNTSGLQMRISLWDELGRLIHRQSAPARGRKSFYCPTEHFIGKNARLVAELLDDKGRIVDQLRAKPVMVGQRQRRQREYQGLLSFGGSRHFFTSVRQNLLRGLAMDTGFTWGPGVNNDLDLPHGYFGVYWYDRGPTEPAALEKAIEEFQKTGDFDSLEYLTKKELYRRTGDKRFLVRTPSLDDPAVLEILASLSRTAARNKAVYNMDYYFVGDEGSLTSYTDNVDFCWGPHTLANFRKWLQGEYGSLEALNRKWGTEFKEWSQVVPYTTEEARKTGRFAPWADHRTYMEISFANAYKVVRDAVVQGDPDGHIAVSGTQVTNAYNGCDWYRLDQIIDHFLSYSGGNQWDFHRSFAKPGSMVGFWTGYGRSGRAVQHEIWSAAFNNVLYPNLFWSYSVFNPDFTFSKSGRDMGKAFSALRFEGIGKLLMEAQRESDLIAIHYSLPSVHAATILGYHPRRGDDEDDEKVDVNFPVNRDGWTKLLSDLGYSYDFLASEQIERGDLQKRGFKVLILPFSLALSPEETKAIREFVENGGVVLADRTDGRTLYMAEAVLCG